MDHTNSQISTGDPAVTTVTVTLRPMTKAQWYRLPAIVRHFHPWERASRALVIDAQTKLAIEPESSTSTGQVNNG